MNNIYYNYNIHIAMFEFAVASHGVSCLTPLNVLQDRDWAQR
jgi:hypothetical protein